MELTYKQKESIIREDNQKYLIAFKKYLSDDGLSIKTINRHVSNVDLYINDYLLYYDALNVQEGSSSIYSFFGNWYIRKVMNSNCTNLKTMATSIKKFYAFLVEINVVTSQNYIFLSQTITENMKDWLKEMKMYNDTIFNEGW